MDQKKVMCILHLDPKGLLTCQKIKASYKALSLKHHPDKNNKLLEEEMCLCNDRFSSILEAYEYIIKQITHKNHQVNAYSLVTRSPLLAKQQQNNSFWFYKWHQRVFECHQKKAIDDAIVVFNKERSNMNEIITAAQNLDNKDVF